MHELITYARLNKQRSFAFVHPCELRTSHFEENNDSDLLGSQKRKVLAYLVVFVTLPEALADLIKLISFVTVRFILNKYYPVAEHCVNFISLHFPSLECPRGQNPTVGRYDLQADCR